MKIVAIIFYLIVLHASISALSEPDSLLVSLGVIGILGALYLIYRTLKPSFIKLINYLKQENN